MTDGLGKYGASFQVKVLTSLLTDKTFIQQTSDILSSKFFDTESKQWLCETIYSHFAKYKQAPTLDTFKIQIDKEKLPDVLKQTVIDDLRNAFKYTDATDLNYIKDETVNFCKNQCIKQAILESVQILQTGEDFETIKVKIDNAMKAGADKEIGHEYNDEASIDFRYTDAVRAVRPTPWDVINDISDGGFGKGELVVFVAPAGIGKSWGLINIGAHANANWVYIGSDVSKTDYFIDANSIQKSADSITFWQMKNYNTRQVQDVLSIKGELTINCRLHEKVLRQVIAYDDINGKGRLLGGGEVDQSWVRINPQSVDWQTMNFVCK
jgi:hypothetical protein